MNIVSQKGGINNDAISIFRINIGPISFKWIAKHFGYIHNKQFQDKMIRGPFQKWVHTHSFIPHGLNECFIEDKIDYVPKFGKIISKITQKRIQDYLNQLFLYRSRILVNDINLERMALEKGKKILITGSHGLIGSALIPLLTSIGKHKITRLVRSMNNNNNNMNIHSITLNKKEDNERTIYWDPEHKKLNPHELDGFDIIIHLAGENIFGRWTDIKKQKIFDSRVESTKLLSESLTKLSNPPSLLICASAIGYYGRNRPNELLTEDSNPGQGFLSEVCQKWENATKDATEIGIRVVNTRFGVVLTPKGGILQKLLGPFKLGLGITIDGNKYQHINWISIEDVIKSIFYSITNTSIRGAINIVSPKPVTNLEFLDILKRIFNTKLSISINQNITKLIFGEMSDELLSTNTYVIPKRLLSTGYKFFNPELDDTLRFLVGKMELK
ncbi:MAG TPA: TIGR01777 family oxidoreductase [Nitrososphaeraceae archaeon]|nr:TIGR01777 family oxidoreductase [Nitrososphaeraceae archaeon]